MHAFACCVAWGAVVSHDDVRLADRWHGMAQSRAYVKNLIFRMPGSRMRSQFSQVTSCGPNDEMHEPSTNRSE